MGAAVQHVHHRHRQQRRLAAAVELGQVAVERLLGVGRGGLGGREGDAEQRVGAEPALVRGAVELDHRLVERLLLGGAGAGQRRGDLAVDVGDRPRDALAGPGVAAVAQLDRLELAGRGAGGHRGEPAGAGLEHDLDLDRRVAARVEDLARVDGGDGAHGRASLFSRAAGRAPRLFAGRSDSAAGARRRLRARLRCLRRGAFGPSSPAFLALRRARALRQRSPCGFEHRGRARQGRGQLGDRRRAFAHRRFRVRFVAGRGALAGWPEPT